MMTESDPVDGSDVEARRDAAIERIGAILTSPRIDHDRFAHAGRHDRDLDLVDPVSLGALTVDALASERRALERMRNGEESVDSRTGRRPNGTYPESPLAVHVLLHVCHGDARITLAQCIEACRMLATCLRLAAGLPEIQGLYLRDPLRFVLALIASLTEPADENQRVALHTVVHLTPEPEVHHRDDVRNRMVARHGAAGSPQALGPDDDMYKWMFGHESPEAGMFGNTRFLRGQLAALVESADFEAHAREGICHAMGCIGDVRDGRSPWKSDGLLSFADAHALARCVRIALERGDRWLDDRVDAMPECRGRQPAQNGDRSIGGNDLERPVGVRAARGSAAHLRQ